MNTKIGSRMRALRRSKGMTASELGDRLGISASAVCKFERGEQKFKLDLIKELSNIFGVTASYIMCMTDNPNIETLISSPMGSNEFYNRSSKEITCDEIMDAMTNLNDEQLKRIINVANRMLGNKEGK